MRYNRPHRGQMQGLAADPGRGQVNAWRRGLSHGFERFRGRDRTIGSIAIPRPCAPGDWPVRGHRGAGLGVSDALGAEASGGTACLGPPGWKNSSGRSGGGNGRSGQGPERPGRRCPRRVGDRNDLHRDFRWRGSRSSSTSAWRWPPSCPASTIRSRRSVPRQPRRCGWLSSSEDRRQRRTISNPSWLALIERLADADPSVRLAAIRGLGSIGPKVSDDVPAALLASLEDEAEVEPRRCRPGRRRLP